MGKAPTIGFLTALSHRQHGCFGGYLVLTINGRPMEFHCTAPVKANRAQEILYGNTLQDYLLGDVIGQTLVRKSSLEPIAICTDRSAMLAVREMVSVPVARVLKSKTSEEDGELEEEGPQVNVPEFKLGSNRLTVAAAHPEDQAALLEKLGELAKSFDFSEPFGRIREAIKEAQQAKAA